MKTGFIQAFANLMKPVSYPYHGILKPCYRESEKPPYADEDMKPPGQEWILAFEGNIGTPRYGYFRFLPAGFLPSSDPHPCTQKTYCTHNVYYFTEVYVYQRAHNEMVNLTWSEGTHCKYTWISGNYTYIYKAWFNYQWCGSTFIWWVFNTGPSSFGRCWKSLTGEFPGYYPMPQKQIVRV